MTMHCTSNLLGTKKKKNDPTTERGKISIPFIKLGVRPTSTPGPRRDQLVSVGNIIITKKILLDQLFSKVEICFFGKFEKSSVNAIANRNKKPFLQNWA